MEERRDHRDCKGGECEILRGRQCEGSKARKGGAEGLWLTDSRIAMIVLAISGLLWWFANDGILRYSINNTS